MYTTNVLIIIECQKQKLGDIINVNSELFVSDCFLKLHRTVKYFPNKKIGIVNKRSNNSF